MADGQNNAELVVKKAAEVTTKASFDNESSAELVKQVHELIARDPSIKKQIEALDVDKDTKEEEVQQKNINTLASILDQVVDSLHKVKSDKKVEVSEVNEVAKELVDAMAMRRLDKSLRSSADYVHQKSDKDKNREPEKTNFFLENKGKIEEVKKFISKYIDEKAPDVSLAMRLKFGLAVNKYLLKNLFHPGDPTRFNSELYHYGLDHMNFTDNLKIGLVGASGGAEVPISYNNTQLMIDEIVEDKLKNDRLFLTDVMNKKLENSPMASYEAWLQSDDPVFGGQQFENIDNTPVPPMPTEEPAPAEKIAIETVPALKDFPENLGKTGDLMAGIFQGALLAAQGGPNKPAAPNLKVTSFTELESLKIPNAPTEGAKTALEFNFMFAKQELKTDETDPKLANFTMAPLIAWPKVAQQYPDIEFPVLLGHPTDRYQSNTKPLRIRWLSYNAIQTIDPNKPEEFDTTKWEWYDKGQVKPKLETLAQEVAAADKVKDARKGPAEKVQDQVEKFWDKLTNINVSEVQKELGEDFNKFQDQLKEFAANPGKSLDELGAAINEKFQAAQNIDKKDVAEYFRKLIPGVMAVTTIEAAINLVKDYTPFDEWISEIGQFLGIKLDETLITTKFPNKAEKLAEYLTDFEAKLNELENTDEESKKDILNKISIIRTTLGTNNEAFETKKDILKTQYDVTADQLNRYIEVDNRRQEVETWKRQLVEKVRPLSANEAKPINDLLQKIDKNWEDSIERFIKYDHTKAVFEKNFNDLQAEVDAQIPPPGKGDGLGDKLLLMPGDEGFIGTLKSILKKLLDYSWGAGILKWLGLVTDTGLEKANARKVGGKLEFRPRAKAREVLENTLHINEDVWDTTVKYEAQSKTWTKELNKLTPAEFVNINLRDQDNLKSSGDQTSLSGLENLQASLKAISMDSRSRLDFTRVDVLFFIRSRQNMGYWKTDDQTKLFSAQVEDKESKGD